MRDALQYDDREPSLQSHSGGGARAIFHGQGLGKDDPKDDIKRYFRLIDAGLHEILKDERAPLVLAGVDYLLPLYREVTEYPHVMPDGVVGSPERVSTEELHARAWEIVTPLFDRDCESAKARYLAVADTPTGTADVKRAIRAAHQGRVETLFVAVGKHLWGTWDETTEAIHIHEAPEPGDLDLLDAAAAQGLAPRRTRLCGATRRGPRRRPSGGGASVLSRALPGCHRSPVTGHRLPAARSRFSPPGGGSTGGAGEGGGNPSGCLGATSMPFCLNRTPPPALAGHLPLRGRKRGPRQAGRALLYLPPEGGPTRGVPRVFLV